jgi:transcriptional regulator with XRE-family HTH domain
MLVPKPIDIHIGTRIETRRQELGVSLAGLAERVGIPSLQLSRFEVGHVRIDAVRLVMLAHALDVPLAYFFEGFDTTSLMPKQ